MKMKKFKESPFYISPKSMLYMTLGNLIYALVLVLFLDGNNIAVGGFTGIAIIVNHIHPVPIGMFVFVLTIPLFIWAYFARGLRFVFATFICTLMYSLFADLLSFLPTITDNVMIAAVCSGILYGIAAVFFLRANVSSGGTDLLSKLLLMIKRDISLGTMYIVLDGLIVLASIFVFRDFEVGIYAVITLGLTSYVTDYLINGLNRANLFYIITDKDPKELSTIIMQKMHRGVTCIRGTGMFADSERNILLVAVKPRETYRLKDIVKEYASDSFMILLPASQVLGEGFPIIDATSSENN